MAEAGCSHNLAGCIVKETCLVLGRAGRDRGDTGDMLAFPVGIDGEWMVPGARIELATPAFSGRRSTSELPRHANNFSSLGATRQRVNSAGKLTAGQFEFLTMSYVP
jgi:hypothetical protein